MGNYYPICSGLKEYIVDVWEVRKHKLYDSDSGSGLQPGEGNGGKFGQTGKFSQNGKFHQSGELHR